MNQIQGPEDYTPPPPATQTPNQIAVDGGSVDATPTAPASTPTPTTPPSPTNPSQSPQSMSFFRFFIHHVRTDPQARLCKTPIHLSPITMISDSCLLTTNDSRGITFPVPDIDRSCHIVALPLDGICGCDLFFHLVATDHKISTSRKIKWLEQGIRCRSDRSAAVRCPLYVFSPPTSFLFYFYL